MDQYIATVVVGYGTGAPLHRCGGGTGVAFGRSPKKALAAAWKIADQKAGWLSAYGMIYLDVTVTKNGVVIYHED